MQTNAVASVLLCSILIAIIWVDLRRQIIPNALNLALWSLGLVFLLSDGWQEVIWAIAASILVAIVGWSISAGYEAVRKRQGLGLGDVKFLAAATPWVGLAGLPNLMLIACVSGILTMLLQYGQSALRGTRENLSSATRFAFGPHLAVGCALTVWFGPIQLVRF